jgi:hypothetical protein
MGTRTDIAADVKTTFEAFNKELTALAPKFAAPAVGRGGGAGGGGAAGGGRGAAVPENPLARATTAKNGLMGGLPVTEQVTKAYNDAKVQMPKAIVEANAVFAKAATLGPTLAKYNLTLTAPPQVKPAATTKPSAENR